MVGAGRPQRVRDGELAVEATQVAHARQCGHLVDDHLRRRAGYDLADRQRIQAVHDHRLGAHGAQLVHLGGGPRRCNDAMPPRHQLRHQPPADRAARTCHENVHDSSFARFRNSYFV